MTKTMVDTIRSTGAQEHQFHIFLLKLLVLCRRIQQHGEICLASFILFAVLTTLCNYWLIPAVTSSGQSGSIASKAEHNVSNEEKTEGMTLTESPTTNKVYSPSKRQWMLCGRPAACHAYLAGTIVTILEFILDEADNETEKIPTASYPRHSPRPALRHLSKRCPSNQCGRRLMRDLAAGRQHPVGNKILAWCHLPYATALQLVVNRNIISYRA